LAQASRCLFCHITKCGESAVSEMRRIFHCRSRRPPDDKPAKTDGDDPRPIRMDSRAAQQFVPEIALLPMSVLRDSCDTDSRSANSAEHGSSVGADEQEDFDAISLNSYSQDSWDNNSVISHGSISSTVSTGLSGDGGSDLSSSGSESPLYVHGSMFDRRMSGFALPEAVPSNRRRPWTHFAADSREAHFPNTQVEEGWAGMVIVPRRTPFRLYRGRL